MRKLVWQKKENSIPCPYGSYVSRINWQFLISTVDSLCATKNAEIPNNFLQDSLYWSYTGVCGWVKLHLWRQLKYLDGNLMNQYPNITHTKKLHSVLLARRRYKKEFATSGSHWEHSTVKLTLNGQSHAIARVEREKIRTIFLSSICFCDT